MATMKLVKEIARVSFISVSAIRDVGSRIDLSELYSRMNRGRDIGRSLLLCGVFFFGVYLFVRILYFLLRWWIIGES